MGCFLVLCTALKAQERRTELSGQVQQQGAPVADVHVMNLSAEKATITDEKGHFMIPARAGDTLLFSAVQLRRKSLVVHPAMLKAERILIPLEAFVNELDEVVLFPYNLSGDLVRDLQQMPDEPIYVGATLGLPNAYKTPPTQAERKLYEATSGSGLVPLNPVLNALTGRTRYLKKLLSAERRNTNTRRVREDYADSLFIQELRIPALNIDDFIYYCEADTVFTELLTLGDRLRMWEFLQRKSVSYRKNNGLNK